MAACAHPSGLVIAGPTAGRLWGLRRMPKDGLIHVIAPPRSHPASVPWLQPYRTSMLDPADIAHRDAEGIHLTSPSRTAVDLTRWLNDDQLRSVIDQVEHDGMGLASTMRRVGESLDTPGRPWARRFLDVLADRAGGTRASDGESRRCTTAHLAHRQPGRTGGSAVEAEAHAVQACAARGCACRSCPRGPSPSGWPGCRRSGTARAGTAAACP